MLRLHAKQPCVSKCTQKQLYWCFVYYIFHSFLYLLLTIVVSQLEQWRTRTVHCDPHTPYNASSRSEIEVVDNFKVCGLEQISSVLNSLSRQLDLVFFSDPVNCCVAPCLQVLCNIDVYHPPLLTSYSFHTTQAPILLGKTFNFNFRKANYELLD